MKKRLFTLRSISIILLLSGIVSNLIAQESNQKEAKAFYEPEKIDDPYMPGDPHKGTSKAFTIKSELFFSTQVNINMFGENILGDAGNEPSIAIDPNNPDRMVIGWRQFDNVESNFRQAGYAYTDDGGDTWTFPGVIEPGVFRSDPVLDCNTEGEIHYNSLSKDEFNVYFCHVFKTPESGFDWGEGVHAKGGDKQWMVIDKTDNPGNGNIYAFWNENYTYCEPYSFTRSYDNGESYEDCSEVPDNPIWGTLAVGPEGNLYAAGVNWQNTFMIQYKKSSSAQDPTIPVTWEDQSLVEVGGYISSHDEVNPGGLSGQVWIEVDKSGGTGNGNIYILATAITSDDDDGDIMFIRSTDGGTTWDTPIKINDDLFIPNTQWFGTLSVAPNGRIDVVWLDTRDAGVGSVMSSLYYACSFNNGESFTENFRLSESFDPHVGWPNQNKMGDYFHMVSTNEYAHLAWAGTFNNEQDVYYGRIHPEFESVNNQRQNKNIKPISFPNPAKESMTLQFEINAPTEAIIQIYGLEGKMIKELTLGHIQAGIHNENIETSSLNSGMYICRVVCSDYIMENIFTISK